MDNSYIRDVNSQSTKHKKNEEIPECLESSPVKVQRTKCNTSTANPRNYLHNNILSVSNENAKQSSNRIDKYFDKNNLTLNFTEENPKNFSNFSFKSFSKVLIDNIIRSREKIIDKKKSLSEQISEFFIDHR
jgi:hypothetical protein